MSKVTVHPSSRRVECPTASICIANYNGERLLADCLESVFSQRGVPAFEVIVHDDASSDGSLVLLRHRYPQVELLVSAENVGFCVSNNRMVAHARGQYVLLLNNDAALFPDALATLLAAANDAAAPGILTLPQHDWETGALVDRGCLLDPFYSPVPNHDPARRDVAYVIGACLFLRRSLWNELGGFPEWMGSIAEDIYLCCLARLRGFVVRATEVSGYRHRQGASFGGNRVGKHGLHTTYRRRRLSECNRTCAMIIFTPMPLAWILIFAHLAMLAMEALLLALLRWDCKLLTEVYGPVYRTIWFERRRLWSVRTRTQRDRVITARRFWSCFTLLPRKLVMLWRHGLPHVR